MSGVPPSTHPSWASRLKECQGDVPEDLLEQVVDAVQDTSLVVPHITLQGGSRLYDPLYNSGLSDVRRALSSCWGLCPSRSDNVLSTGDRLPFHGRPLLPRDAYRCVAGPDR